MSPLPKTEFAVYVEVIVGVTLAVPFKRATTITLSPLPRVQFAVKLVPVVLFVYEPIIA